MQTIQQDPVVAERMEKLEYTKEKFEKALDELRHYVNGREDFYDYVCAKYLPIDEVKALNTQYREDGLKVYDGRIIDAAKKVVALAELLACYDDDYNPCEKPRTINRIVDDVKIYQDRVEIFAGDTIETVRVIGR